ncbi:7-carboxy-7-deazaguanine synthase QueE [Streptomyces sp. H34-S4]|uniref:7-carboxy-7-deazaguanine synthase QueE n=1 Tax=Streptomyces sp. H34-S4 TaxID=2996463 RepID=UPI00226E2367|nr:7-carboxy-7-deazaguanine synthase QueE [Streptomyces sp. H34-S4]MCY0935977.1 7-carboxy-7-deazaguanine synthase QueE [Streptomyces sp. H34-S4]
MTGVTTRQLPLARSAGAMVLCEVFGPTLQGEGPSAGQRAMFVRLGDCNLICNTCDTKYSWDWKNYVRGEETEVVPVDDVLQKVLEHDVQLLIVTGGEPLLQQEQLARLAAAVTAAGRRVEIETNGTSAPSPELDPYIHLYVVSPKLAHMGMSTGRRIRPEVLAAFQASGKAVFKFVLDGPQDAAELAALQEEHGLAPVWVMPQATSAEFVLAGMRELADVAIERGWNLSSRLHCVLWGDERGR